MPKLGTCRAESCRAEIRWAVTDKGKGIPLDPEPVETGNLIFAGDNGDGRMIVRYLPKSETPDPQLPRYVTHFATCPANKGFRKSDKKPAR